MSMIRSCHEGRRVHAKGCNEFKDEGEKAARTAMVKMALIDN